LSDVSFALVADPNVAVLPKLQTMLANVFIYLMNVTSGTISLSQGAINRKSLWKWFLFPLF
jgi:hypothetical protein